CSRIRDLISRMAKSASPVSTKTLPSDLPRTAYLPGADRSAAPELAAGISALKTPFATGPASPKSAVLVFSSLTSEGRLGGGSGLQLVSLGPDSGPLEICSLEHGRSDTI